MFSQVFGHRMIKNLNHNGFNPLSENKILPFPKLKAFADDSSNVSEKVQNFIDLVKNIVGKEKMLVATTFSFSHNVFKQLLS